jgi:RimJ/RimL family protein N-acetyltransferase
MSDQAILSTERLSLVRWKASDIMDVLALHGDPQSVRYIGDRRPWSRAKARTGLRAWVDHEARHGLTKWRLVRREDGAFVGRAGFTWYDAAKRYELGFSVCRSEWGAGYATEIAAGLRDWFFRAWTEPSFIGFAHVDNQASLRVLEKIGMRPIGAPCATAMPCRFYEMCRPALGRVSDGPSP